MCLLCSSSGSQALVRRNRVLQLLALVEHRGALPADTALRLAQEILMLTQLEGAAFQCEAMRLPRVVLGADDHERRANDTHRQPRTASTGVS